MIRCKPGTTILPELSLTRMLSPEPTETPTPVDEDMDKLMKDLSRTLKKAKSLSNALRWRSNALSNGGYLHNDFFMLQKNLNTSNFPLFYRIKTIHLPALTKNSRNK